VNNFFARTQVFFINRLKGGEYFGSQEKSEEGGKESSEEEKKISISD